MLMFADAASRIVTTIPAIVALIGAAVGLLQYFSSRTRRERVSAIGTVFEAVVESLASDSDVKRLAAAIRLRRFFDPDSEVGAAGAPYAKDALAVIAGILRSQPTGNFQKLLADGLIHAHAHGVKLGGADFQRTNLQGAYLGGVDVSKADFYRADLSQGSLKKALARGTVFYQARLAGTVLEGADLRDADFFQADLSRAKFTGAKLTGAKFAESLNLPTEIASCLDDGGVYVGPESLPPPPPGDVRNVRIFVSRPSTLNCTQAALWSLIEAALHRAEVDIITVPRTDYPTTGILRDIRRVMAECDGIVVLGFRQLEISAGMWRAGTDEELMTAGVAWATPWNQIEAGLATGLGLPAFLVRETGVKGGVFDLTDDAVTAVLDLRTMFEGDDTASLQRWISSLAP